MIVTGPAALPRSIIAAADISIIIPAYRRSAQLHVAVQSALAQELSPVEIIVVDDASPDEERPSVPTHSLVRSVRRDTNGGVSAAQNSGLGESRGAFVCFLHSDDVLLPTALATQVRALAAVDEGVCAVESASIRSTPTGERVVGPRFDGVSADEVLRREVHNVHITPFLLRREALVEIGGFDERLRAYEDFDLLLRLRRRWRFSSVGIPTCRLHQHGEDRLAASPWMQHARARLLDKYLGELARFDRTPRGWQEWAVEAALLALQSGDGALARRRLAESCRGDGRARVRRLPLVAASYFGASLGARAAALYRDGSRARRSRQRG